uniref:MULE transposase domain-containing protein n=1 Tax=Lactuca sativa TaxID=4236 RepID=A0A9R1W6P1_LACSA|nr:hypothetical protein LSAT_V11C200088470 [Lactuca sativa]
MNSYGISALRTNIGSYGFSVSPMTLEAIKEGWKVGCRRVIGLDGSFLKGQCKGELLTAIGRDENNHVYPIAWAITEIENKPNWQWFLELLHDDLELQGGLDLCVISDQHKGLLEAIKVILLHVEHRQCARHLYENFRKVFSGIEFKNMFWTVSKSTVEGDFKLNMEKIKEVNHATYDHLMAREPKSWCKAFLKVVENGMAECFNAIIIDARKKPLLAILKEIRLYMMSWYVRLSDLNAFEVRNGFHSYGVNLEGMYYTCRLWELSGIPCYNILPVNSSNMWEPTPYTKPLPPVERRMPGRPCMKRKRHVSEHQDRFSQVSSKGRTIQCQNCMQMRYNKVYCKNPSVKPTPKKIGRPRLNPELTNFTRLGRGGARGGRGGKRGGRSGRRGYTSVYEEGKKEPVIETQFVTQTTPNVESQFVTQTAPTVDSEHVPETQEADLKIDVEGDGLDMADLDQILHDLSYLRESKYSEAEIILCFNITQSQLKGFDALLHQSK